ncbi:MAG: anti-sigma factor family protein [Planctomycetota bacterium]|jgi:hypothetical protein
MSKDCEKMQDKIVDYILGDLSQEDCDVLNEHIAVCSKCRQYMQILKAEKSLLREFAEKVDTGMKPREEIMAKAITSRNQGKQIKLPLTCRTFLQSKISRLAVAAVLLIAVGYFAGWLLPPRSPDVQQLQAALETSLKSSLEQTIQKSLLEQVSLDRELALERHYARLKDELTRQLHQNISDFAVQTLAASRAVTDRRLADLIQLIEAARTVDHYQIRMALERMESNRLQDKTYFGKGMVSLAAQNKLLSDNKK